MEFMIGNNSRINMSKNSTCINSVKVEAQETNNPLCECISSAKTQFIETVNKIENENDALDSVCDVNDNKPDLSKIISCSDENNCEIPQYIENVSGMKQEQIIDYEDGDKIFKYADHSAKLKIELNEVHTEETNICVYGIKDEGRLESINSYLYCLNCKEMYNTFCCKCNMLCYILDNCVSQWSVNRGNDTIPKKILQIKETFGHHSVFSLRSIPQGVKFGPLDGLETVQSTVGRTWKLKGGKPIPIENASCLNWMQFINCAKSESQKNLIAFQQEDKLYYRTDRSIDRDEELLVYYGDEQSEALGSDIETSYYPAVESRVENIYACTFCCVGFSSQMYLMKHKTKCPYEVAGNLQVGVLLQCPQCKIYLVMKEYYGYHVNFCTEKYASKCIVSSHNLQITRQYDARYQCEICKKRFGTSSGLKRHFTIHTGERPFHCKQCDYKCTNGGNLVIHTKNVHGLASGLPKEYICPECHYETNRKNHFKKHLDIHYGVKMFTCNVCDKSFSDRSNLSRHNLIHSGLKSLFCNHCDYKTNYKHNLRLHLLDKHSNTQDKTFKCTECQFQTNHKSAFNSHVDRHNGIKPFDCKVCGKYFVERGSLNRHFLIHSGGKQFMCHHCDYKCNYKRDIQRHIERRHARYEEGMSVKSLTSVYSSMQ